MDRWQLTIVLRGGLELDVFGSAAEVKAWAGHLRRRMGRRPGPLADSEEITISGMREIYEDYRPCLVPATLTVLAWEVVAVWATEPQAHAAAVAQPKETEEVIREAA